MSLLRLRNGDVVEGLLRPARIIMVVVHARAKQRSLRLLLLVTIALLCLVARLLCSLKTLGIIERRIQLALCSRDRIVLLRLFQLRLQGFDLGWNVLYEPLVLVDAAGNLRCQRPRPLLQIGIQVD